MKQCIHGTKAFCHICWKKGQEYDGRYVAIEDHVKPWEKAGFPTKKQFDNDKISCGTSYN